MLSAFATSTEAPTTCDCATACLATASRSDGEVSARDTASKLSERVAAASSGPKLPIQRRLAIKAFIEFFLLPLRVPGVDAGGGYASSRATSSAERKVSATNARVPLVTE